MTYHMPPEASEALIELGSSEVTPPATLERLARFEAINRLHFDSLYAVTEFLSHPTIEFHFSQISRKKTS